MNWDEWIQSVGGKIASTAVDVYAAKEQAKTAYNVQAMTLAQQQQQAATAATASSVSPTVLLIGGVLLVGVLFMSDRS
jgi:hypothetical protein